MKGLRPFQVVLLAIFGFLAVVSLIFMSAYQAQKSQEENLYGERVVIWGTFPADVFKTVFQEITRTDKGFGVVEYYQVSENSFDNELVNAIAEGRSPDLVVLKADALVQHRAKLFPVPYETISERNFKDSFVDGAEIFALQNGIYGQPLAVDPLVMYWNRDMFSSNGIAQAPVHWETIVSQVVPKLTIRDSNRNVLQSAVSFGEYRNVEHGKELLMLLTLQSGSQMVFEDGTKYRVNINEPIVAGTRDPFEAAVQFYTDFSNVNSPLYSWNRSMPNDKDAFIAGDLGLYFGLGSEVADIERKNPNLNFDVAAVPQGAGATAKRTYGDFYALAIPRAAPNGQGAFKAAQVLTSGAYGQKIAQALGMSSPRRAVIAAGDDNLYRKIILDAALIARAWLDPSPSESDGIFMQMIEDIVSNRLRISDSVQDAIGRLMLVY